MASKEYWLERLSNNIYKNDVTKFEKKLVQVYKKAYKVIDAQLKEVFLDMLADGEISYSTLMKNNRLKSIMDKVDNELKELGTNMSRDLQASLLDVYKQTYIETTNNLSPNVKVEFGLLQDQVAKEIVNQSYKGARFSERVWDNLNAIRGQIENKVIETTIAGKDYKKASRELRDRLGVSLSDSNRIVRTETMRVLNQSAINTAKERGYSYYEFLATNDDRTCDECMELDGKVFPMDDTVHMPPLHPHSRSTIKIVIDK